MTPRPCLAHLPGTPTSRACPHAETATESDTTLARKRSRRRPPKPRPGEERGQPPHAPEDDLVRREGRDPEGPSAHRGGGAAPRGRRGDRQPGHRGPVRRRRCPLPVARPRGGRGAAALRLDDDEPGPVPHRGPGLRAPRRPVEPAGRAEARRPRAGPRPARRRRGQEGCAGRDRRRPRARVPAAPRAEPRPPGPARRGGGGPLRSRLPAVARAALAVGPTRHWSSDAPRPLLDPPAARQRATGSSASACGRGDSCLFSTAARSTAGKASWRTRQTGRR
jgi:hypothetical protein